MKKALLLLGMLGVSVALIGCGNSGSVIASLPNGFEIVSEDDITRNNQLYTLKHIKSGCFYSLSVKRDALGGTSITQMFIKENGVSVPYCD